MEALKKIYIFLAIVLTAVFATMVFMVYHHDLYFAFAADEWWQVLLHCIPQHCTVAGYAMAIPFLLELIRIWIPLPWHRGFMAFYLATISILLFVGWFVNTVLYGYWGIVLDGTAMIYLLDNPVDALAESPLWAIILAMILVSLIAWGVFCYSKQYFSLSSSSILPKWKYSIVVLLICGLDFLAIRGGWTTSTMNPGRAYFSSEMALNHASVDPVFNFIYSIGKQDRFDKQYRFWDAEECLATLGELNEATQGHIVTSAGESKDSINLDSEKCDGCDTSLLKTPRPNILLIILESFSGSACHYLTPEADSTWMPNVNRLMAEGIAFTRFYANSFRTDRGVAAILASYPGQPTNSIMKDQSKCDNLQFLSKQLSKEGYNSQFIHGGDVNFTNMQGFLRSGGITDIVADSDFPIGERLDKWGVRDDRMFSFVGDQVETARTEPFFKILLTLSSHEPFDVPYHHFSDKYLNSVAYADSCLGAMITRLKSKREIWDNLLIIGLPDHCFAKFPASITQHEPLRYHIPMFWTGGAVVGHREVQTIGQQTDLAATLMGQLGIRSDEFVFSKDMFDPTQGHYAFYAFSDGFGLITDSCQFVQDNKNDGVGLHPGTNDPEGRAERWGKAYLQNLYDDLQSR